MKTTMHFSLAALFLAASLSLSSCKKDNEDPEAQETELAEQSQDEADFSAETEQVLNDADLAVFNNVDVPGGRTALLCGAQIDTSTSTPRTYTITFDGSTPCNGRIRSGTITLTLYNATSWSQRNAVLGLQFFGYSVRRVGSGRQFSINGTGSIHNVTGGLARQLMQTGGPDSVVHKIKIDGARLNGNNVNLTDWHIAKRRIFVDRGRQFYTITTAADTNLDATRTLVAAWGKTRRNREFYTRINRPIHSNSDCGWFKPVSGQKQHMGLVRTATVTFGVDAEGTVVNPGAGENCAYGYKVDWTGLRGSQTRIVQYD